MKAEDIAELVNNVKTLKEHNDIITWFENTETLDRDEALAKYRKFNNEHPDFYAPHKDLCERQGCLADLGETNNKTIVENMKCQRDWLIKESFSKFGEETLEKFIQQMYGQI